MANSKASEAASTLGKRSYRVRLERFGIERIREIARENGKLGGRPPKERKRDGNRHSGFSRRERGEAGTAA